MHRSLRGTDNPLDHLSAPRVSQVRCFNVLVEKCSEKVGYGLVAGGYSLKFAEECSDGVKFSTPIFELESVVKPVPFAFYQRGLQLEALANTDSSYFPRDVQFIALTGDELC